MLARDGRRWRAAPTRDERTCEMTTMADLHNDVTYEGWGKNPAEPHRECMGN